MVFSVTEFLETPTVEEFELLKKDDLISLGLHFKLAVKSSMRKQEIKVIVVKRLLQENIFSSYDFPEENVSSETKMSQYEFELEKMKLQLEYEQLDKERKERMQREQIEKEERMQREQIEKEERMQREQIEKEERMNREKLDFELPKLKLEKVQENPVPSHAKSEIDVAKNIRLVPKFQEKSVDKYFPQFEKIAANLKWPREFWPTLLQSVLIGKAAEVYSALREFRL